MPSVLYYGGDFGSRDFLNGLQISGHSLAKYKNTSRSLGTFQKDEGRILCCSLGQRIISSWVFPGTSGVDGGCYGKSFLNISKWSSSESCKEDAVILTPSMASKEIVADKLRLSKTTQLIKWSTWTRIYIFSFLFFVLSTTSCWFRKFFANLDMFWLKLGLLYLMSVQRIFLSWTWEMIWKSFYSH